MTKPEKNGDTLDQLAAFNRERWDALADARVQYSVPALDLDRASARELVDPLGVLGELSGVRVLCLAGGGGQQSAAFSLLGAAATVLDLSSVQLERDRLAARHYGYGVQCELGDMRDLSRFSAAEFDLVWHAHSLNFVPDARGVFAEVARVLRAGGRYWLECTNPFIHGAWESSWTGQGYLLALPYTDGEVATDEPWRFVDDQGTERQVDGPREFRHTFGTLINSLVAEGLQIQGLWEDTRGDPQAPPGSWQHFKVVAAPWVRILTEKHAG
jgi:ubiquinone/menaquinone biosynthesis C-methylase UbiE